MAFTQASEMSKEQQVIEQTRFMVYKHYWTRTLSGLVRLNRSMRPV